MYLHSRELMIAYTISRHFEWSQNIVFIEDLPGGGVNLSARSDDSRDYSIGTTTGRTAGIRNTIILSSSDGIVPTSAIERYLKAKCKEGQSHYEHYVSEGPHGHMMFSYRSVVQIGGKIRERCGITKNG